MDDGSRSSMDDNGETRQQSESLRRWMRPCLGRLFVLDENQKQFSDKTTRGVLGQILMVLLSIGATGDFSSRRYGLMVRGRL